MLCRWVIPTVLKAHSILELTRAYDRWLRTGDEVTVNEDKEVFIVDRLKVSADVPNVPPR